MYKSGQRCPLTNAPKGTKGEINMPKNKSIKKRNKNIN